MTHSPAIGDMGLLGDTRTAALVDISGHIVWMCLPHFDGEPVFATLVAGEQGGEFLMGPAGDAQLALRRYRTGSTVLETAWRVDSSTLVLTEGMVSEVGGSLLPTFCLVRRLEAHDGPVECRVRFDPRFGFERRAGQTRQSPSGHVCVDGGMALSLTTDHDLALAPGRGVEVTVHPGQPLTVVLSAAHRRPLIHVSPEHAWHTLLADEARWRHWCSGVEFDGPYSEAVERSLITLRLLTYSPSGAPVAAPTTSLPESLGGSRNWDYRYAWPRDASIGIGAFLGVGLTEQARAFLYWLLHASRLDRPRLPALLTLHGRRVPPEREATGWPGYAGSRPVRFGNAARDQHQLDNYGWVLDAMWLLVRAGHHLYGETWRAGDGVGRLRRRPLARTGLGSVGGARRTSPLRALQTDGLAGARPCVANRRHASHPGGAAGSLGGGARRHRRGCPRQRCRPAAQHLRARLRPTRPRRRRCSSCRCSVSSRGVHRVWRPPSRPCAMTCRPAGRCSTGTRLAATA